MGTRLSGCPIVAILLDQGRRRRRLSAIAAHTSGPSNKLVIVSEDIAEVGVDPEAMAACSAAATTAMATVCAIATRPCQLGRPHREAASATKATTLATPALTPFASHTTIALKKGTIVHKDT